jgi:hypothetical protein
MLTVGTLKDALMLVLKGATYLETPKHAVVLRVHAIQFVPEGWLLLLSQKGGADVNAKRSHASPA